MGLGNVLKLKTECRTTLNEQGIYKLISNTNNSDLKIFKQSLGADSQREFYYCPYWNIIPLRIKLVMTKTTYLMPPLAKI